MEINRKLLKFFESLSDKTRLTIVTILSKGPKNVTDIHLGIKNISLSAVSHQLKLLSYNHIIVSKKQGREKIYSLSDTFCWCILKDAKVHFNKSSCKECLKIKK